MATELDLDESANAVLTGLGYGLGFYGSGLYGSGVSILQVTIGPIPSGNEWRPTSVMCNCTSINPTTFTFYRNTTNFFNAVVTSLKGNQDYIWLRDVWLRTGDYLFGVWSGADVGSLATMRILGRKFVPGSIRGNAPVARVGGL